MRCTCTNGDLPSRVPFGSEHGDFLMEGTTAISSIVALRKPTPTFRPPLAGPALWRLISQLSLNYLSLVEEGKEALQEILKLYQPAPSRISISRYKGFSGPQQPPHGARRVGERHFVCARHARRNGAGRRQVRRRRSLPVRQRAGTFPGAVRLDEQLQPVGGAHLCKGRR